MGVLALVGAVRFGCGAHAGQSRAAPVYVINERGVRLTILGPQNEDGGGGGAGAVGTATSYALMT